MSMVQSLKQCLSWSCLAWWIFRRRCQIFAYNSKSVLLQKTSFSHIGTHFTSLIPFYIYFIKMMPEDRPLPSSPPPRPPPPECGFKRRKVKPKRHSEGSSDYYANLAAMAGQARKLQRSMSGRVITTGSDEDSFEKCKEKLTRKMDKQKRLARRSSSERVRNTMNKEVGFNEWSRIWNIFATY